MRKGGLERRARALEEIFFANENNRLLQSLREDHPEYTRKQRLAEAAGVRDEGFLEECLALDVHSETLAALMLVPLIEVAWSDGEVSIEEKSAILRAAGSAGVHKDTPPFRLLEAWLQAKPSPKLFTTWKTYVAGLRETLTEEAQKTLRKNILDRSHQVADAAGGFWGFGNRVSEAEQAVLSEVEQALS